MIISAGVLLECNGKFLLGRPSGGTGTTRGWGILKGKVDKGETIFHAACREFKEESGFDVFPETIISKDVWFTFPVGKKKTVHVFRAWSLTAKDFKFHCDSMIDGTKIPEIDKFCWATPEEALELVTESQKCLFRKLINDIN